MFLITGASQGIGLACAHAILDRTEAPVMITGRCAQRLEAARSALLAPQRERLLVRVSDHAKAQEVESLGALVADESTPLQGVILGVGVNTREAVGPRHLHTVPAELAAATIETNCTHTLRLTAAVLGRFRRQRGGVLIWIGSQGYRIGIAGSAVYGATKGFLVGLAHAAHREYAGRGVRVHLLNPGLVRTPRLAESIDRFAARHDRPVEEATVVAERIVDRLLATTPGPVEEDV